MKSKTPTSKRKTATARKTPVKRQKMQSGGQMNQERRNSATPGGGPTRRPTSVSGGQMDRGSKSGPAAAAARRGNAEANAAQRRSDVAAKRLEDAVSVQRTGGGNYGTYQRGSQTAASFREAYANARRAGKDTFTWRNRRYTTE